MVILGAIPWNLGPINANDARGYPLASSKGVSGSRDMGRDQQC